MHISKQGDSYRVVVQHKGRRSTASAKTRAAAEIAGAKLLLQLGARPSATETTVSMILADWQATAVHSPTYAEDVARVIDDILPEHFTSMTLDEVRSSDVKRLYRELTAAGVSAHRMARIHNVLRASWQSAIEDDDDNEIPANPVARVPAPKTPPRNVTAPHVDDVMRLLAASESTPFGLYLQLSAVTGARRGEIVALQWGDIIGTSLHISRSLSWTNASGLVERPTKTGVKGQRVVAIPDTLATALASFHLEQREKALAVGLTAPIWVFSHNAGRTPWLPNYATNEFVELCKRLEVTGVRLHDMRHFMATQLLASGEPASVVSKRLGHTTQRTTEFYLSYVQAADQHAAATMDRILNGRTQS